MNQDLKLVETVEETWDCQEYLYDYKGYTIREFYYHEEDCNHHNAIIYKDGKDIKQFNWDGCMIKAMEYIDSLVGVENESNTN